MSFLQVLFLIILIGIFIVIWSLFKKRKIRNGDFVLFLFAFLMLLVIDIFPRLLWIFTSLLAPDNERFGRIIFLLVVSNITFFFLLIFYSKRIKKVRSDFDKLVKNLAIREFSENFGLDSENHKNIVIVIPAYNEANNLKELLPKIPDKILGHSTHILVCVDGATDDTEEVVKNMGSQAVVHNINLGGGAAIKLGYEVALKHGADIVVTMDADGQHLPEEIELLVKPVINNEADITSGSRILGSQEKGEAIRQVGIMFFNKLISFLLNKKITDCSNAYRAIKTEILADINLTQQQFHTTELLIEAIEKGYRVKEMPVTVVSRFSGTTKKPKSLRYGWGFTKAIITTWWRN